MKKLLTLTSIAFVLLLASCKQNANCKHENKTTIKAKTMDPKKVAQIKEFYRAVDAKEVAKYAPYIADNYVDHNRSAAAPKEAPDQGVMLNTLQQLTAGFPDGIHNIEMMEELSDDKVMIYWSFDGTHNGDFYGTPPTGNKIHINGIDIFRFKDGKFTEQWHIEDLTSLFAQLAPKE